MKLSVIIPVYNEQLVLPMLFARLYPALDALAVPYEVVFVDDGSRDRSVALLAEQFERRPDETRVVLLAHNAGQHMAILAGFESATGSHLITLDADLQNPPEEIGKVLAAMRDGADYVGTIRVMRQDSWWRRFASRQVNKVRERTTRIRMTDQGCMLRGYDRRLVDLLLRCREVNTFIPALAYTFARHPVEIEVAHAERAAGESKYSMTRLMRLNFDLMTGFSIVPLQVFSVAGIVISALSIGFFLFLLIRRLIIGPEAEGLFTLFSIAFFLIGILLLGLGIVGEYIGRIYQQVRDRPRYVVASVLARESSQAHDPALTHESAAARNPALARQTAPAGADARIASRP